MATIVLAAAGAAVGGAVGGTVLGISAAAIGQAVGAAVGSQLDARIFGQSAGAAPVGKVSQFRLQSAAEGAAVARVFGRMRVPGHLIWSSNFKETLTDTPTQVRGGKGGRRRTVSQQVYSYSINVAFALGEGEIGKIGRIWADGEEIAPSDMSLAVYRGTQAQMPDPTIAAIEGAADTPAFRGTAYVVIENLELARFGNRIPQFNFEVFRATDTSNTVQAEPNARDSVRAAALIPGSGEYILAQEGVEYPADFGNAASANEHTHRGGSDFVQGVEDLITDAPNCGSVALVVSWFGDDLRANHCSLRPKVEQNSTDGEPMPWRVDGLSRGDAERVSYQDGKPAFGGTPSDESVIQAIKHLKNKGLKVVFYPFILMDIPDGNSLPDPWTGAVGQPVYPWRGRITSSSAPQRTGSIDKTRAARAEVTEFFGTPTDWGYRRFILHYANLCKTAGGVDAFCIGSEMRSLTQIRDSRQGFPAVTQLVSLASAVRGILGSRTKIGYAADWSEYFGYHPNDASGDVLFHLDPLWASANIDFVGIDNYMPLSDWRDGAGHADAGHGSPYSLDYLRGNIEGGEGYDWYYASATDRAAQTRTAITDGAYNQPWIYRYKDIKNWWRNRHYNRINGVRQSRATAWRAQSKPIWFTELGCPAIDKGANQPNVFVDPKSSESFTPYYSNGTQDELIQLRYIKAVDSYWRARENNPISTVYNAPMLDTERSHIWCWDARPWPEFPARTDVWSDGANYQRGHWISGRLFHQELGDVVAAICESVGFYDYDVSAIYGVVIGFTIGDLQSARDSLGHLMQAYDFTAVEAGGVLYFQHTREVPIAKISADDVALDVEGQGSYMKTKSPVLGLPSRVRLGYYDPDNHYLSAQAEAVDAGAGDALNVSRSELPLALRRATARHLATNWLHKAQAVRDEISFALPLSRLAISAGDVVQFSDTDIVESYLITEVEEQGARIIQGARIEPTRALAQADEPQALLIAPADSPSPVSAFILDIPRLNAKDSAYAPYLAASSGHWRGVSVFSSPEADGYQNVAQAESPAVLGRSLADFVRRAPNLWAGDALRVRVSDNRLQSRSELAVLNGANVFAIKDAAAQDWEIVQYREAELQADGAYILRGFLRGQLGTEWLIPARWAAGADIVFLDSGVVALDISPDSVGLPLNYLVGPSNQDYTHKHYQASEVTARGVGWRPYAPVHLRAVRAASGVTFSWIRRSREGGDGWNGLEIPLGEAREQYIVRVLKDGAEVQQQLVTSPAWTYSTAQSRADGTLNGFELSVAQVSENYGAGPSVKITV